MTTEISGIDGLTGRDPIGAAITIGHKGPKGNPTDTDRFFIVVPQEENGIRAQHPAFAAFNGADPEKRKAIRGMLVHASPADCFHFNLRAQQLPGKTHPKKRPACVGDGHNAVRWGGLDRPANDDDFRDIPCPNEKCEFRKSLGDNPTPCKPFMRFLFRPIWPAGNPLPTPLTKLTSGSWNTVAAFSGFFEYIDAQAKALGVPNYTLYGLPFVITLAKKKRTGNQASARSFPILGISPDVDLQSFLFSQQDRAKLYERPIAKLTDREERETVDADYRSIVPGISRDDNQEPE